jgi:diacylglycerol kinase (ATP)
LKASGFRRIVLALRFSYAGLRHAAAHEPALREELVALVLLTPIAVALPVTAVERLLLILPLMLLVAVELLNTAIERTVDRISVEVHPLAAQAKDLGSAAVLIVVLMASLSWTVIAGPVVLAWIRS